MGGKSAEKYTSPLSLVIAWLSSDESCGVADTVEIGTTAETKEGYSTVNFSVVCIFLLHVFLGSLLCASDARLFFFRYTARSLFSSSISDFYFTFSLPGGYDEFDAFFFSCSIMVNTSFKKSKPSFMSSRSLSLRSLSSLSLRSLSLKMSSRRMIGC